jgi:hypothetical protein
MSCIRFCFSTLKHHPDATTTVRKSKSGTYSNPAKHIRSFRIPRVLCDGLQVSRFG